MSYGIRVHPSVLASIASWGLTDSMLVDVYLKLRETLAANPVMHLRRDPHGNGSFYTFSLRTDDIFAHVFNFRVFYDLNETHLNIVHGSYALVFLPE